MKKIFVISVFTVFIGLLGVLAACAFFYPLEVYNTVQRLRAEGALPKVTIESPKGNAYITNTSYTVWGNAKDDDGIDVVYFSRNNEPSKKIGVDGITWTTNISNLDEGTNTIEVYVI